MRALADLPLSRNSSNVSSGTHSSLKAIRYSAISSSSAHGQPDGCRSPSPRTHQPRSDTRPRYFQSFRIELVRLSCRRLITALRDLALGMPRGVDGLATWNRQVHLTRCVVMLEGQLPL